MLNWLRNLVFEEWVVLIAVVVLVVGIVLTACP